MTSRAELRGTGEYRPWWPRTFLDTGISWNAWVARDATFIVFFVLASWAVGTYWGYALILFPATTYLIGWIDRKARAGSRALMISATQFKLTLWLVEIPLAALSVTALAFNRLDILQWLLVAWATALGVAVLLVALLDRSRKTSVTETDELPG